MAAPDPQRDLYRAQYAAWGVVVQTSNIRAAHVANGVVQLLRLASRRPEWGDGVDLDPSRFAAVATGAMAGEGLERGLSAHALALCIYKSKSGPLSLAAPAPVDAPEVARSIIQRGREHLARILDTAGAAQDGGIQEQAHRTLADALNADGKVMITGGADPTTPGLAFAGFTPTHTIKTMHAATFLGLLGSTSRGRRALVHLYDAARRVDDPHASLASFLGLTQRDRDDKDSERRWPPLSADDFEGLYPVPRGEGWDALTEAAGEMAGNIARRQERGATKAETLMSLVDLALLLLATRMLRWERCPKSAPRLLLAVCSQRRTTALQQAIARGQESLRLAAAALDEQAHSDDPNATLIRKREAKKKGPAGEDKFNEYFPSNHSLNLASAGGWLFPLDARGGAPRYLCPGPRQFVTLVHALVPPGEERAWSAFASEAEGSLGIALGGANDSGTERALRMGGVAATLREAAKTNQERLIALGLARRESDNVVIVDGGAR